MTPTPQYFSKSTAVQMGGVLPYKWEAYCSTNGRCIAGFPFLRSLEARKARRYKWGAYCRTNWRCTAVLSSRPVGVGLSETSLTSEIWRKSLLCGISGIFLEISASEKCISDSGKWPFHTPPIHPPTKCQPKLGGPS